MAVTVGFEPTVGFHPHNFSRVAPSAARTRHRDLGYLIETWAISPKIIAFLRKTLSIDLWLQSQGPPG